MILCLERKDFSRNIDLELVNSKRINIHNDEFLYSLRKKGSGKKWRYACLKQTSKSVQLISFHDVFIIP